MKNGDAREAKKTDDKGMSDFLELQVEYTFLTIHFFDDPRTSFPPRKIIYCVFNLIMT